jgi:hypothetical protein
VITRRLYNEYRTYEMRISGQCKRSSGLLVVTSYSLVSGDQHFGETNHLNFHGFYPVEGLVTTYRLHGFTTQKTMIQYITL